MKVYLIFNTSYMLLGYVQGKETFKLFMKYRNPKCYEIEKLSEKKFKQLLKKTNSSTLHYQEPSPIVEDVLLFPAEEELFFERVDYMVVNTDATLDRLITKVFPKIRWNKKDYKTVIAYLREVYEAVKRIEHIDVEPEDAYHAFEFAKMLIFEIEGCDE